jgi:membrane-bound ClpP family serine protease
MTFTAQQSRVDALIRLLGVVVLVFGAAMVYYTYSNVATTIAPEILTINYALGGLLLLVGVLATFSKFK